MKSIKYELYTSMFNTKAVLLRAVPFNSTIIGKVIYALVVNVGYQGGLGVILPHRSSYERR